MVAVALSTLLLDELAVRDSHTAVTVDATLVAPLPEDVHQVSVSNGNYPQLAGLFRTQWGLGPAWRMTGGSMVARDDRGRLTSTQPTAWDTQETARESRLDITPRPAWDAWTVPVYDEPVTALTTARPSLPVAWRDGVSHPLMAVLPVLLAPLAGIAIRMPKKARGAWVRAAIAVAVGVAGGAAGLWLPHGVIVGVLVVGVVGSAVTRWGVPASLGALTALAAMPPLWPWAFVVGAAGALAVHRREPNRLETVGVVMALGIACLWAIRWAS